MNESIEILAAGRESRRERAIVELAAARGLLDLARTACENAHADVGQATQWRVDVSHRCAMGRYEALRGSTLPACEALLQRASRQFVQSQLALKEAHQRVVDRLQTLATREREALRLDAWRELESTRYRREQANRENREDEERLRSRVNDWQNARPAGRSSAWRCGT